VGDGGATDSVLDAFLDAQRERVFEVVAGLDETQLRTAALPSGWTPLQLVEHLGHAERHWFQEVLLGAADPLPWPDEPDGTRRTTETVFAFYRDQIARATVGEQCRSFPDG
jgi:uncharacterized damage-inducible protein DinB